MQGRTILFVLFCVYMPSSADRKYANTKINLMTIEELSGMYQLMKPQMDEMQIKIEHLEQKVLIQDTIIEKQNVKIKQQIKELDIVKLEIRNVNRKPVINSVKLTDPYKARLNSNGKSDKVPVHEASNTETENIAVMAPDADNEVVKNVNKRQQATSVAFTSYLTHDLTNLGANQIIPFDGVELNEGNAYNHLTGIFTVPMNGVYLFSFSLEDDRHHRLWFKLVVDGQLKSGGILQPSVIGNHIQGTNVVILRMTAGQAVWIAIHQFDSGDNVQGAAYMRVSAFSGVYLYP